MYTITLNDDQYVLLLVMLGFATGAAYKQENPKLANSFLRLANAINIGNPNWKPYEVDSISMNLNLPPVMVRRESLRQTDEPLLR